MLAGMGSSGKASFLVTIWSEAAEGDAELPLWRGSVEHLASRRRLYFSSPNDLIGFLVCQIQRRGSRAQEGGG